MTLMTFIDISCLLVLLINISNIAKEDTVLIFDAFFHIAFCGILFTKHSFAIKIHGSDLREGVQTYIACKRN